MAKEKVFKAGAYLYNKGEEVEYFYVITRGTVVEEIEIEDAHDPYNTKLGVGSFLSFANATVIKP